MSEQPERPAQPGTDTQVPKDAVAGVQAALDATFNAAGSAFPDEVERQLRAQLAEHGVDGRVSDVWVIQAAGQMAAGQPVVAEPEDA